MKTLEYISLFVATICFWALLTTIAIRVNPEHESAMMIIGLIGAVATLLPANDKYFTDKFIKRRQP